MKYLKLIFSFAVFLLVFPACNDDEDDSTVIAEEWEFQATFNITDPDTYSFDAEGTATVEYSETAYAVIAQYTIGNVEFNDVIVEGAISNGVWDFSDQYVEVLFQNGDIEFTEYINFSIPDIDRAGGNATGAGTISIENSETGAVESGTITFTATEIAR